jgi:hypothetical protein
MKPFDPWGEKVVPEAPIITNQYQYNQMWRCAELAQSLMFLRCTGKCKQPFAVFKLLCQKDFICPYCGGTSAYEEQDKLKTAILRDVLRFNGRTDKI